MNKKIRMVLIVVILFLALAVVGYIFILPMFADSYTVVDNTVAENNSMPVEEIDLMAENMVEDSNIDSTVGESDILPLEDSSDPILEEDNLAIDFDLLTEDQRSRILAGELTMDDLRAEMEISGAVDSSNTAAVDEDSVPTLLDTSDVVGDENINDLSVLDSEENMKSDINYGEPDIQTDVMIPTLSASEDPLDTLTTDVIAQEEIKEGEDIKTPQKDVDTIVQEVELDTTYDYTNVSIKGLVISFLVILIFKFVLYRRSHL